MKNVGLILWNDVIPICETYKTSWLMGKHLMKDDSEIHLKAPLFRLVHLLSIIRLPRMTNEGSTNLVRKYQEYSLDMASFAEGIQKGDILVADIEELEIWTRQKSVLEGSMQKKY